MVNRQIIVDQDILQDAINIKNGVYSPLRGFLRSQDYQSVLDNMRLADGRVWSIPIILPISQHDYNRIKDEKTIELTDQDNKVKVVLDNIEIYHYNKAELAQKVYGTLDNQHPGVAIIQEQGDYLVGGDIIEVQEPDKVFPQYNFTPAEMRKIFQGRGWQKVVAFQTRNVPHLGHEYLQKYALQQMDGLFIQPVIGQKKQDDFLDEHILSSYEVLIDKYFSKNKVVLGILPLRMRYAGPREAVLHALIRKNFGCTHFIVGRDHAGVGNYYDALAAHKIFDEFKPGEIGIEILKYPAVVFNKQARRHCFVDKCPDEHQLNFSGSQIRQMIKNKQQPPAYLMRREVFNLLTSKANVFVNAQDKQAKKSNGFVLWFTGLSASGKSTIADALYEALHKQGIQTERLDGDIVRENLTKDLGFSKEDRDENIRRVGFVSKLLARNGVGVLAAFISPYREIRQELRIKIPNFIEVFVDAPLEVCEQRDKKGLYKKARAGEIPNFTGISDPYEPPLNPEIHLETHKLSVEQSVEKIMQYLKENRYISQ